MEFKIYSVRDVKANAYLTPVFFVNDGQAIRAFSDAVLNNNSGFSKHPEDYSLFKIGVYDDASGNVSGNIPEFLSAAVDYIKPVTEVKE